MYDVIIIGGGPAGLTASIYLARAGIKCLILEREAIGGQIASSPLVENYPGYKSISGSELADNLFEQATSLGVDVEIDNVIKAMPGKVIGEECEYECNAIIIATGSKYRTLGLENEQNLIGKGIHFCTSCDAAFYKDKIVAVIGGANSAVGNALYLADICKKVYLIYRGNELRCEKILNEKIKNTSNIEVLYNSNVIKLNGDEELESIIIDTDGTKQELKLDGIFESIGMDAQTDVANDILQIDDKKYFVSSDTKTNIEGIFVAGDCISKDVRQLTTAVNDGTLAAIEVIKYLKEKK